MIKLIRTPEYPRIQSPFFLCWDRVGGMGWMGCTSHLCYELLAGTGWLMLLNNRRLEGLGKAGMFVIQRSYSSVHLG